MVTPLPRRRPWVVARQTVTLDHLSGGRLVLGVGIGVPPEEEFGTFGEPTGVRDLAERLDEALDVIVGMWSGELVLVRREYYEVKETTSSRGRSSNRESRSGWPGRGPTRARSAVPLVSTGCIRSRMTTACRRSSHRRGSARWWPISRRSERTWMATT